MRPARTLGVVALLLLGGTVAWRLRGFAPPPEAAAPSDPARTSTEAVEPRLVEKLPAAPEREEVAAPVAEPRPALPAAVLDAPAGLSPRPVTEVRGRVVVIDTDDREIGDADGTLTLAVWRGGVFGEHREVAVEDGVWSLDLDRDDPPRSISVRDLRVAGKPTSVEQPEGRFLAPFEGELLVRARLADASVLRVVDAGSGLDLAGVWLVPSKRFPDEDAVHPGPDFEKRSVARDLRSPILLDEHVKTSKRFQQSSCYLVGASGYAWERVEVDPSRGGERLVSLVAGADLAVSVQGVEPSANTRLRLRASEHPAPLVEVLLWGDGLVELDGLPPGACRVVAEIGDHWNSPIVLGETAVELFAHELTRVDLVLGAAPRFESAPAGGIVYVPEEWGEESVMVVMDLLDTPLAGFDDHHTIDATAVASERTGFDAFRWKAKKMQVGRYELGVSEPSFSIVVDLPSGGRDDIELTIPSPVVLSVQVVDDATGDEVITDSLSWHPRRPEGVSGGGLEPAERDPDGRGYTIRAPETEIQLMLWAWEYQPYSAAVDLSLGVREHTIRLERGCGIVLRMVDGKTPIPFPPDWYGEAAASGGDGHVTLSQHGTFDRKFMVSEPGTYSIELPSVSGYVRLPVQRIEVFAGRFSEHVVALERQN